MRSAITRDLIDLMESKLAESDEKLAERSAAVETRLRESAREFVASEMASMIALKDLEDKDKDRKYVEKNEVQRMIDEALRAAKEEAAAKQKDQKDQEAVDLEEMVDYALETQGGSVVDEASSETYVSAPSTRTIFGFSVW